ncbi:MAG: biotin--[acetyl-CoA-carboxylase] ligase [Sphingorhabdus sp.]|uniref:biotin--[acetyl-CoA-carboxylase] ligase n=1 Tax=Sphingorhabdus sp. TaxID=1902408 RepID=UPI0038FC4F22
MTGSTNADLLQRAAIGAPEGLWLRADAQDGGRGRMGRSWESPAGNLFASTIVRLQPTDPQAPSLAFVAALAVRDTLHQIAPECVVQIKWPNDVLSSDGAKLCGILLERTGDAVVVGIGINLTSSPEIPGRATSNLKTLGVLPPHSQAVTEILASNMAIWLARWRQYGLQALTTEWQKAAHPVGTALSVQLPNGEREDGLYGGLTADGALLLRLADGTIHAIHAADVFLV